MNPTPRAPSSQAAHVGGTLAGSASSTISPTAHAAKTALRVTSQPLRVCFNSELKQPQSISRRPRAKLIAIAIVKTSSRAAAAPAPYARV